jgi:hypothetical protein
MPSGERQQNGSAAREGFPLLFWGVPAVCLVGGAKSRRPRSEVMGYPCVNRLCMYLFLARWGEFIKEDRIPYGTLVPLRGFLPFIFLYSNEFCRGKNPFLIPTITKKITTIIKKNLPHCLFKKHAILDNNIYKNILL